MGEKDVAVLDAVRGGMIASAKAAIKNSKSEEVRVFSGAKCVMTKEPYIDA